MIENEQSLSQVSEVESHVLDFQALGIEDNRRMTCLASIASQVDAR